jgi:hypothetical protein
MADDPPAVLDANTTTVKVDPSTVEHPGRVVLLYPHPGNVGQAWHRSVCELMTFDRSNDLHMLDHEMAMRSGANINRARNKLVAAFLNSDATWAWFCDTDMVFNPDTLLRLVVAAQAADAKIIGALCCIVNEDSVVPTLFIDDDETITRAALDYPDGAVVEVAATGTGCLLIHRDVFEKMQANAGGSPWCWFNEGERKAQDGSGWWIGEDVMFCLAARDAGFPVYVDCTTPVAVVIPPITTNPLPVSPAPEAASPSVRIVNVNCEKNGTFDSDAIIVEAVDAPIVMFDAGVADWPILGVHVEVGAAELVEKMPPQWCMYTLPACMSFAGIGVQIAGTHRFVSAFVVPIAVKLDGAADGLPTTEANGEFAATMFGCSRPFASSLWTRSGARSMRRQRSNGPNPPDASCSMSITSSSSVRQRRPVRV